MKSDKAVLFRIFACLILAVVVAGIVIAIVMPLLQLQRT